MLEMPESRLILERITDPEIRRNSGTLTDSRDIRTEIPRDSGTPTEVMSDIRGHLGRGHLGDTHRIPGMGRDSR